MWGCAWVTRYRQADSCNLNVLYFDQVMPGELTIVTGVPNSGKSEWIDALLCNLNESVGWKFALCSMENNVSWFVIILYTVMMLLFAINLSFSLCICNIMHIVFNRKPKGYSILNYLTFFFEMISYFT